MSRQKRKEDLQVFAEFVTLTTSPEWRQFYSECAAGRFPQKVKYAARSLVYRRGTKSMVFNLPSHATPGDLIKLNAFFQEQVGLTIEQAASTEITTAKPLRQQIKYSQSLRNICLYRFCVYVQQRDNLTPQQFAQLFVVIGMGWLTGAITMQSFVITPGPEDGPVELITDITGLVRAADGTYEISLAGRKVSRSKRPKATVAPDKRSMTALYEKYSRASMSLPETPGDSATDSYVEPFQDC